MIDKERLNAAGISYEAGMQRFMQDEELYEEVLTAFAGEDTLARAETAYQAHDDAALLRAVHEAKGSGGNAGLDRVYAEAGALVLLLRGGGYTADALAEAYARFKRAYMTALTGIRSALGR